MCGRFTLRAPVSAIAKQFSLFDLEPLEPRFNVAPTQTVAVVRAAADGGSRQLAGLRWGLVPGWAKDPSIGNRLINARAETAAEKPAFRAAFRRRRCLVAADGFYEWQKTGSRRQPYFFHLADDRPFGFAGLWEVWEGPDHSTLESCTILTTDANDVVRPIHDRMPVIVALEDYARWLDPRLERAEEVASVLCPYEGDDLSAYPVSARVNSPTHEGADLIERLPLV